MKAADVSDYRHRQLSSEMCIRDRYDVVEAVEGTYMFSRCLDGHYNCNRAENGLPCNYRIAFARISDIVCDELKKLTFDDFTGKA